jgi:dTDP-glucose 4,6-dehydratase
VEQALRLGHSVINLDKLSYAAFPASESLARGDRYRLEQIDLCDAESLESVLERVDPDGILHLAAETHVDRSIDAPDMFVRSNIVGTFNLLQAALKHWRRLSHGRARDFRFHHVSTDEVFGSLDYSQPSFDELARYDPRSPYAASKAASDHLVRAWGNTYGLPVIVSNCTNNYGPKQFPEKLIPMMIINSLLELPLPVYGRGDNVRDWIFVDDHATALLRVFEQGRVGESYNIGGRCEMRNMDVVQEICRVLDEIRPRDGGRSHADLIAFVEDRPGHDRRYSVDPAKVETELGWRPEVGFSAGLRKTVNWYLRNEFWWERVRSQVYDGGRLGRNRNSRGAAVSCGS